MKSNARLGILIICVLMGNLIMSVSAAPQNQTVDIAETGDDGFMVAIGRGIDSQLLVILDPEMDIRAYLVFEDIDINPWEVLTNATLRLTSASTLPFDADSSVTVYGMKQSDLGGRFTNTTTLGPGEISSMPFTSAHTNVNTSQFYGGAVLDINVTSIVRELYGDPHWDGHGYAGALPGDDMGFIILGAQDDTRYFYDYLGDPARSADLIIHWGHAPAPPSAGGAYNETYRDLNIWEVDLLGENRTGSTAEVNWNILNMTELTEIDSGVAMTLNNDTWVTISSFIAQQHNAFYNDTGAANINSIFVRFAINTTSVTNNIGAGDDRVMALFSATTVTPVGGAGLLDDPGHAGNWAGLIMQLNADDVRYNFRLVNRAGGAFDFDGGSGWFSEADGDLLYFEMYMKDDGGAAHWYSLKMYDDPDFTNLIVDESESIDQGRGPWRYPQVISSLGFGTSRVNNAEFYTWDHMPVANATLWIVTLQNGTQIGNATDYDDAIILADDFLGADPSDPDPPSQDWPTEGPFQRFQTRMFIWFMGYALIFGPLGFFGARVGKVSGYEFVIGCYLMLMGLGFLLAAGTV